MSRCDGSHGALRGWRWYAWHLLGRHGGRAACERYRWLARSQWWDHAELTQYAAERLQEQLAYARRHVPYYRAIVDNGAGLSDFPVLNRAELHRNFEHLRAETPQGRAGWPVSSSGSSGQVVRVLLDRDARAWGTACAWRGDFWGTDLAPEARQVSVFSAVNNLVGRHNMRGRLGQLYHNRLVLEALSLDAAEARRVFGLLQSSGAKILAGYPSVLLLLARFGRELGLEAPRFVKVIPTAEGTSAEEALELEQYFGCPVRQRYGCHELVSMAHQCEHGRWHLNCEVLKAEVRREDGSIGDSGRGELLCTSLVNRAMPLVRYALGDVVDLTAPECPCGRGLPTFTSLDGRVSEYVYCPDGRWITSHAFLALLRKVPARQFQIIQQEAGRLRVLLVPEDRIDGEHLSWLESQFQPLHGGSLKLDFELVDSVELSPSGKLVRVINRLPRPAL